MLEVLLNEISKIKREYYRFFMCIYSRNRPKPQELRGEFFLFLVQSKFSDWNLKFYTKEAADEL